MNQKGLAPIFIIIIVIAIFLAVLGGVYFFAQSKKVSEPAKNQNISEKGCSDSYGGCDKDQNFYKWTDDGLP